MTDIGGRPARMRLNWPLVTVISAVVALGVACQETSTIVCGSRVCPASLSCAEESERCVPAERVEACQGSGEGEACTFSGVSEGRCERGVCESASCGDGVLDAGEVCDDGNRDAGDGCSDDCRSDESCGNGIIDKARGETCDEGDSAPGDGCSAECRIEGCGNGKVEAELGEVCDDENTQSGDGCRADCAKVEVCGDAIVDEGEQCDDGNENPVDGCGDCRLASFTARVILGESGVATAQALNLPTAVATDANGNIFVADSGSYVIRRVDAGTGVVTTVAGTGRAGTPRIGVVATSSPLGAVSALATNGAGDLYLVMYQQGPGNQLFKVDAQRGVLTLLRAAPVTSGVLEFDGLDSLYFVEGNRVARLSITNLSAEFVAGTGAVGNTGDGGAASAATFGSIDGLAFDGLSTLFVSSKANHRVRRIDLEAGTITAFAGTGTTGFSGDGTSALTAELAQPTHLAAAPGERLYILDSANARIRAVDFESGEIESVAGGGTDNVVSGDGGDALEANLAKAVDVDVDPEGRALVVDQGFHTVRRLDGASIDAVFGTQRRGDGTDGRLAVGAVMSPWGLAYDGDDSLYVSDFSRGEIRRVSLSEGTIWDFAGRGTRGYGGEGGLASDAVMIPETLAFNAAGDLVFSQWGEHVIRRIDRTSGVISLFAGQLTSAFGGYAGDGGPATEALLSFPRGLTFAENGDAYWGDTFKNRVRRVDALTGNISTIAGSANNQNFSGDGGLATAAELAQPHSVAVAADGTVYLSDYYNLRIRRIDGATGIITTIAGDGQRANTGDGGLATAASFNDPYTILLDTAGGLLVTDSGNHRVRRIDLSTGMISAFAGSGVLGFSGDGGPALEARLNRPRTLALGPNGDIFMSDESFVRRVSAATGIISTVAGPAAPPGMGSLDGGRLSDPQAFVIAGDLEFYAGGGTGTVQVVDRKAEKVFVGAGRYPDPEPSAGKAIFQGAGFGDVLGIAVRPEDGQFFFTESTGHRIHAVSMLDPADTSTWTIVTLAGDGTPGYRDGLGQAARFRSPKGLFLEGDTLYVVDSGNHVVRALDLSEGLEGVKVSTRFGVPERFGFFGDGSAAKSALLSEPVALTRCKNGDFFIADAGNHRVRRVDSKGVITTVLGDGVASSSGQGSPAREYPVDSPSGLDCDAFGNLLVTSRNAVRFVAANDEGVVDGDGLALTIYRSDPAKVSTSCLRGLKSLPSEDVQVVDCSGVVLALERQRMSSP